MVINFISDTISIVDNYRGTLIDRLETSGFTISKYSLEDFNFLSLIFSKSLVVSSNMRANIVVLTFCRGNNVIILNGLGRWRESKTFRYFLKFLMRMRSGNEYIIQNYADYRYFKRYLPTQKLNWICGTGGTEKRVSNNTKTCVGVVSREAKLFLQVESISDFEQKLGQELQFVGVDNVSSLGKRNCYGYVNPSEIFQNINELFLPDGYGEGFPHVACDALTSGMRCWLSKKSFVQYGCSKMDVKIVDQKRKYLCIESQNTGRQSQFSNQYIHEKYLMVIKNLNS